MDVIHHTDLKCDIELVCKAAHVGLRLGNTQAAGSKDLGRRVVALIAFTAFWGGLANRVVLHPVDGGENKGMPHLHNRMEQTQSLQLSRNLFKLTFQLPGELLDSWKCCQSSRSSQ